MQDFNTKTLTKMILKFLRNANEKNASHNETGTYMVPVCGCPSRQLKIIRVNTNIIQEIYNYLVKFSNFKYRFSYKDVHDLLMGVLTRSYGLTLGACASNIKDALLNLSNKYFCIVPIYNLEIDNDFKVGFIHFYKNKQKNKILKIHNCLSLKSSIHNDLNFAGFYVYAGHPHMALSLAYNITKRFTDACSVLFSCKGIIYRVKPGNFCSPRFGNEILVTSNNGRYVLSPFQYFSIRPLFLNKLIEGSSYKELLKAYLEEIVKIEENQLKNEPITTIEKKFLNANELVAEGINSEDRSTKIVKFISALEILLVDKSLKGYIPSEKRISYIGKSSQVSHKVPYLLKDVIINGKKLNQSSIQKELHYLYNVRSYMVHQSITWVNNYYLDKLWSLSKITLLIILEKYILQNKTQNDLNNNLNILWHK